MIPLPDLRQTREHDCGAVAVRIALRAIKKRPPADLETLLGTSPIDGTDPRSMESLLRSLGLWVASGSFTLADLHHITTTRPAICLVTRANIGHYVTVGGIVSGTVHYQCPSEGPCRSGTRSWMKSWRDVDRLGATYHQWLIAVSRPPAA
jgi:ABC-type bacteriocin/lantibiotic exporter with double-glycine peptidase domain